MPALQYRDYKIIHSRDKEKYVEGIKFFSQAGKWVINYPKDHISNGKKRIMIQITDTKSWFGL